jgi:uncharacterized membrane protein YphA (DoxX/SURF4 family)
VSAAGAATSEPLPAARALAALRIFVGAILLSNGLAKLLSFSTVEVGPYRSFLIDRDGARGILEFEINRRGGDGTDVPGLKSLVNDVVLANWELIQWLVTALEVGAGTALVLGIASRAAALLALGQQLFLQLVYLSSGRWMWEQPHEWVPLLILALVPAGRIWGLDRRLAPRRGGRWPF